MSVVAKGLDPGSVSVGEVMSMEPETAGYQTTVLDALHTMHDSKVQHLPVVGETGEFVGVVDVLQLTLLVLERAGEGEGGNQACGEGWQQLMGAALGDGSTTRHTATDIGADDADAFAIGVVNERRARRSSVGSVRSSHVHSRAGADRDMLAIQRELQNEVDASSADQRAAPRNTRLVVKVRADVAACVRALRSSLLHSF